MRIHYQTFLGMAHITDDWFGEPGFHPFVCGCGIAGSFPTIEAAQEKISSYLEALALNKKKKLEKSLRDLESFINAMKDPRWLDSCELGRVPPK